MSNALVYIIIVNWNGLTDTLECLASIKKIDYKKIKIILVDNGSTNDEASIIKKHFPYIKVITNSSNLGFSYANNQGISHALVNKADFILLLNNDTYVNKDFLSILVNYSKENNFNGILTSKILYYKKNTIWSMGGKLSILTGITFMIGKGKKSSLYYNIIEPDFAIGCCMLINRKVVEKIGLLDTDYFAYYEDADYGFRARKSGFKTKAIPNSVIWHKLARSSNQKNNSKLSKNQAYLMAKNAIIFGVKNLNGIKQYIYLINQYTVKAILYLIFKCLDYSSMVAYIKGLTKGLNYIFVK